MTIRTKKVGAVFPALFLIAFSSKVEAQKSAAGQKAVTDAILSGVMDDLWEQIDGHFHQGEYNHAINLSRVIVQAQPQRMECYGNAAWLLWSTDRNTDAIAFL